jgi:hypothetical protein
VASPAAPRLVPRMADVTDRVEEHFRLFNEAGGTLQVTWRDGAVAGLTVTFDA